MYRPPHCLTIGGSDLVLEVIRDRIICDPEGKYHHQFRFKLGDRDWVISKELPEELVALAMMEQKWIPVTERLPETFGEYIVAVQDAFGKRYSDYADFDPYKLYWRTGLHRGVDEIVTHWMPMPEPPKGE